MLKRKAYQRLLNWKEPSRGSSALQVEGARRVGKSTLVTEFGGQEYASCLFVDFNEAPAEVFSYFEDYRAALDTLFLYLSAYYRVDLLERDTLVVFDEVQMYPPARALIKYLVADGRYDYIETGSLLSIKQNVEDIVLPSEEEAMCLDPLDFEEFLWAMGEKQLADLIRRQFELMKPLPDGLHRRAMGLLREYMLVGGMPRPLAVYVEQRRFATAETEKRRIIQLYRNDIAHFARGYEHRVVSVFDEIPGQLSKHEKKFILASLGKSARMRTYEEAFFWLADARIANVCFAASEPSVGLTMSRDLSSLKCYMADTGLLVTLAFADNDETSEEVYRSVLRGDIGINEGMLTENVVAQMLVASGHKLFFYSQSGRREDEQRMEVDFLVMRPFANAAGKPRVSPVEVKPHRQYGTIHWTGSRLDSPLTSACSTCYTPSSCAWRASVHTCPSTWGGCCRDGETGEKGPGAALKPSKAEERVAVEWLGPSHAITNRRAKPGTLDLCLMSASAMTDIAMRDCACVAFRSAVHPPVARFPGGMVCTLVERAII